MDVCGTCFVYVTFSSLALLIGWQVRRDRTVNAGPEGRLRGWLMFGFGVLGWSVWGPTIAYFFAPGLGFLVLCSVLGMAAGLVVGYCTARIIGPLLYPRDEDDDERWDDDAE